MEQFLMELSGMDFFLLWWAVGSISMFIFHIATGKEFLVKDILITLAIGLFGFIAALAVVFIGIILFFVYLQKVKFWNKKLF